MLFCGSAVIPVICLHDFAICSLRCLPLILTFIAFCYPEVRRLSETIIWEPFHQKREGFNAIRISFIPELNPADSPVCSRQQVAVGVFARQATVGGDGFVILFLVFLHPPEIVERIVR